MRRRFRPKTQKTQKPRYRVNEYIRIPKVFVIDEKGEKLGEMSNTDAIELAKSKGLDLVEVSPKSRPPVCKIANFGKFQYTQSKQNKKSKQKKVETKGVRIGIRTSEHDLDFKRKQVEKFIKKGHKVKIEMILRGREKAHQNLAKENLQKFIDNLSISYSIDQEVKRFPGGFNSIIKPE